MERFSFSRSTRQLYWQNWKAREIEVKRYILYSTNLLTSAAFQSTEQYM